ncbi:hypothetical protein AQ490_25780 [Wenjunlia vitaminophila]|uniref:SGNH hydrolase-type esterase domain-containing protein n=1 Tax=Wenjunlia vitaminophila TaxID=76728 RepID=A0A0T6LQK1_WENVI|nr:SGNH/GDSL hydrolase family protein [Wenjunlia vitaminophila]KRV48217.1 hypothetical protein AQ490_25780 [Wenjunlia vitaminophila]
MSDMPGTDAYPRERDDPYCLSDAEAYALLREAPWRRFVVLGDGLAEGLGEKTPGYRPVPWPERIRYALSRRVPTVAYLNLGRHNLVTSEVRASQVDRALAFHPDLAAVICGGNDLLTERFDPRRVEADLEAVVTTLLGTGADVILFTLMDICAGVPELSALRPHMNALNESVRDVSLRHDTLLVDLWGHPICSAGDVYSSDLTHPSTRGHAVLASQALRRLGERLATAAR